jgi:thioredoxin reductase (NADPH)
MLDTDQDPDAGGMITCLKLTPEELPVVVLPDKAFLRNPSTPQLADSIGLTESFDPDHVYDLTVVGAGPAGLASAVYGASEGSRHAGNRAARPWWTGRHQLQD